MLPQLALVPGEPAGVGPELCLRLIQQPRIDCRLLAFADPDTLHAAAAALSLPLQLLPEDAIARQPGDLPLRAVPNAVPSRFGTPDPANAGAVIASATARSGRWVVASATRTMSLASIITTGVRAWSASSSVVPL